MSEENPQFEIAKYVLGPFIIFLGVLRLFIYYKFFGINILAFLTLSEIIVSFFDNIFLLILILIVLIYAIAFFTSSSFSKPKLHSELPDKIKFKVHRNSSIYYILSILFIIVLIFLLFTNKKSTLLITLNIASFLIVIAEIRYFSIKSIIIEEYKVSINPKVVALYPVLIATILIWIVFAFTSVEINKVRNEQSINVVVKLSNDSTLMSKTDFYYLGKTEQFLFFFHDKEKTVDVIPINEVKSIHMK